MPLTPTTAAMPESSFILEVKVNEIQWLSDDIRQVHTGTVVLTGRIIKHWNKYEKSRITRRHEKHGSLQDQMQHSLVNQPNWGLINSDICANEYSVAVHYTKKK